MVCNVFNAIKTLFFVGSTMMLAMACNEKPEQPVEKLQYFDTGKVSRRYFEINGKKEGKMTDYYPEGELKAEKTFKDGKQEGRTLVYYPSGKTKEVQYYEEGLKQGSDTVWYEDGKPRFVAEFNNGKKDGYMRTWAPDGSLTYEAKYENETLVEVKGKPIQHSDRNATPADTSRNGL
jgi:antitoxin component YwqK of YwqJK toxin-antitoxin module